MSSRNTAVHAALTLVALSLNGCIVNTGNFATGNASGNRAQGSLDVRSDVNAAVTAGTAVSTTVPPSNVPIFSSTPTPFPSDGTPPSARPSGTTPSDAAGSPPASQDSTVSPAPSATPGGGGQDASPQPSTSPTDSKPQPSKGALALPGTYTNIRGLRSNSAGQVFVVDADYAEQQVYLINGDTVTGLAGSRFRGKVDGKGQDAKFDFIYSMDVDIDDGILVREFAGYRHVDLAGNVKSIAPTNSTADKPLTFAGRENEFAVDKFGDMVCADDDYHTIDRVSRETGEKITLVGKYEEAGDTNGDSEISRVNWPKDLVADRQRDQYYVADTSNHKIKRIDPVRGSQTAKILTIAGDGTKGDRDGVGANARFDRPWFVALDFQGNVWVSGERPSGFFLGRIRRITPDGVVSTPFTFDGEVAQVAVTPGGDLYFAGHSGGGRWHVYRVLAADLKK